MASRKANIRLDELSRNSVESPASAGLAKGKTIGQGLDEMDRIAAETLGDDFRTALAGDSKEFRES